MTSLLRVGGPILLAGVLVVIVALARLALRPLRRQELRARLFELMRLATSRGEPLAPMVGAAAEHLRGRSRRHVAACADRLERGQSLAVAIADIATPEQRAAFASARDERGTALLLRQFASETARGIAGRHRLGLLFGYAMLVAGLLLVLFHPVLYRSWYPQHGDFPTSPTAWSWIVFALAASGLLVSSDLHTGQWLRSALTRRGPGRHLAEYARLERAFRCAALRLGSAGRLEDALRCGAGVANDAAIHKALTDAAGAIERGTPLKDTWTTASLPRFVTGRLAALATSQHGAARLLSEIADACARRHERRTAHWLRWSAPVVLLILGALVAVNFAFVFRVYYASMREVLG